MDKEKAEARRRKILERSKARMEVVTGPRTEDDTTKSEDVPDGRPAAEPQPQKQPQPELRPSPPTGVEDANSATLPSQGGQRDRLRPLESAPTPAALARDCAEVLIYAVMAAAVAIGPLQGQSIVHVSLSLILVLRLVPLASKIQRSVTGPMSMMRLPSLLYTNAQSIMRNQAVFLMVFFTISYYAHLGEKVWQ